MTGCAAPHWKAMSLLCGAWPLMGPAGDLPPAVMTALCASGAVMSRVSQVWAGGEGDNDSGVWLAHLHSKGW